MVASTDPAGAGDATAGAQAIAAALSAAVAEAAAGIAVGNSGTGEVRTPLPAEDQLRSTALAASHPIPPPPATPAVYPHETAVTKAADHSALMASLLPEDRVTFAISTVPTLVQSFGAARFAPVATVCCWTGGANKVTHGDSREDMERKIAELLSGVEEMADEAGRLALGYKPFGVLFPRGDESFVILNHTQRAAGGSRRRQGAPTDAGSLGCFTAIYARDHRAEALGLLADCHANVCGYPLPLPSAAWGYSIHSELCVSDASDAIRSQLAARLPADADLPHFSIHNPKNSEDRWLVFNTTPELRKKLKEFPVYLASTRLELRRSTTQVATISVYIDKSVALGETVISALSAYLPIDGAYHSTPTNALPRTEVMQIELPFTIDTASFYAKLWAGGHNRLLIPISDGPEERGVPVWLAPSCETLEMLCNRQLFRPVLAAVEETQEQPFIHPPSLSPTPPADEAWITAPVALFGPEAQALAKTWAAALLVDHRAIIMAPPMERALDQALVFDMPPHPVAWSCSSPAAPDGAPAQRPDESEGGGHCVIVFASKPGAVVVDLLVPHPTVSYTVAPVGLPTGCKFVASPDLIFELSAEDYATWRAGFDLALASAASVPCESPSTIGLALGHLIGRLITGRDLRPLPASPPPTQPVLPPSLSLRLSSHSTLL